MGTIGRMPKRSYADLLSLQSGVIARRQLTELGVPPHVRIGVLLQARGWTGAITRCPECPGELPLAG